MRPGKKCGVLCDEVEESKPRKRQEDESGNCGKYFLCPSVGIQKRHQEHLLPYARITDENLS